MDNCRAYMAAPQIRDGYYRLRKELSLHREELGLQIGDILVHAVLAARTELSDNNGLRDENGPYCYYALAGLAEDCGTTVYAVSKSIRRLEACGLLVRITACYGLRYYLRAWAPNVMDGNYPAYYSDVTQHYIAVPRALLHRGLDLRVVLVYAALLDRLPLHVNSHDEVGIWQYFTAQDFARYVGGSERTYARVMAMAQEAGLIMRRRVGGQRRWRVYVYPYTRI